MERRRCRYHAPFAQVSSGPGGYGHRAQHPPPPLHCGRCFEGLVEASRHPARGIRVVLSHPDAIAIGTVTITPQLTTRQWFVTRWFWLTAVVVVGGCATCCFSCIAAACLAAGTVVYQHAAFGFPPPTSWVEAALGRDAVSMRLADASAAADEQLAVWWAAAAGMLSGAGDDSAAPRSR